MATLHSKMPPPEDPLPTPPANGKYQYTEDWHLVARAGYDFQGKWNVFKIWFSPLDSKFYWLTGFGDERNSIYDGVQDIFDFHRGSKEEVFKALSQFAVNNQFSSGYTYRAKQALRNF